MKICKLRGGSAIKYKVDACDNLDHSPPITLIVAMSEAWAANRNTRAPMKKTKPIPAATSAHRKTHSGLRKNGVVITSEKADLRRSYLLDIARVSLGKLIYDIDGRGGTSSGLCYATAHDTLDLSILSISVWSLRRLVICRTLLPLRAVFRHQRPSLPLGAIAFLSTKCHLI